MKDCLRRLRERLPRPLRQDRRFYFVGGTVRDCALGRPPQDIDLVFTGRLRDWLRRHRLPGRLVPLKPELDEYRLVLGSDFWIDLSGLRAENLWQDLERRDFTLNSIAVPLDLATVLDPTDGLRDLRRRRIRAFRQRNLRSDPVRLLRAFRFQSVLGFEVDPQTLRWIGRLRARIHQSAPERIHEELMRLFAGRWVFEACTGLRTTGLLFELFPELRAMDLTFQRYLTDQNLLDHTLDTLRHLQAWVFALDDTPLAPYFPELQPVLEDPERRALLFLAALLHDIGKPRTLSRDAEGRTHFLNHERVGARMAAQRLQALRFARREWETVAFLVRHHMYPHHLAWDPHMTDRAVARYVRRMGEWAYPLLLLAIADALASPPELIGISRHLLLARKLREIQERQRRAPRQRLLTGHDLKALGIPEGPVYREILETIQEEFLAGRLQSRAEALARARELYESRRR